ncbi:hypothetical protein NGB36_31010 [Streptomyces sp. RB6PN25]|uniref:Tetratricopeptide repeat protein n=1 Tax=Streptomyces humicola TaxID=2953240 RepID=A0ABT1Q658_9ACTN|nr:hypothetical protein [Streptomyces humicola]MCQ4084878.1 hypothetical protein [Streptomyces humicola]
METRIGQAVMLLHGGDREEARHRFAALWEELGDDGSPLHRCTLAHFMADAQDDPEEELAWDLKALRAADAGGDATVKWGDSVLSLRGFYPSLHLSLAGAYVKLGEFGLARGCLAKARKASHALGDDAYGDGVRAAIGRMELRLGEAGRRPDSDQLP